MDIVRVYKCLADFTRLRILNLLIDGPLCVCHLHEILDAAQPKISKSLNLMRDAGMLETRRHYNWTIYRISPQPSFLLSTNLACLQDLRSEVPQFRVDLDRRKEVVPRFAKEKANDPIGEYDQRWGDQNPCC
jgi:ArsR family transcriptional regulator